MAGERVERRLAAVLVVDVAGYSRLMGVNEEGTLAQLKVARKEIVDPAIASHRGRIVKTTGDGMLVEFASAVDAVTCAMDVQRKMADRSGSGAQTIAFRIGINVGDIIIDDNDIFGDGVNIAARLEAMAEPGGICISDKVFAEIKGKVAHQFHDLGRQKLKNIVQPIRVYRARRTPNRKSWLFAATSFFRKNRHVATEPPSRPDTPKDFKSTQRLSIVVLPFVNLSGNVDEDYFADAITADLTNDLSRISGSFVIARNTAFTFKGKAVDIRQIGRDLGVRYALEGSVRRNENDVRVNAQLIDTESGTHIFAERFDGDRRVLFQLQNEFTSRLARTLNLQLIEVEGRRAHRDHANNPDAVDLAMRGQMYLNRPRLVENFTEARSLFEQALHLDPELPAALIGYSIALSNLVIWRWVTDRTQHAEMANDAASRVVSKYPDNAEAHLAKGDALRALKRHPAAILEYDSALALNPNLAPAYSGLASSKIFAGRAEEAFEPLQMAIRISPRDPSLNWIHALIAHAHEHLGQHEAAIESSTKAIALAPYWLAYVDMISAFGWTGQLAKAKDAIVHLNKLVPNYTVSYWLAGDWSDDPVFLAQIQRIGEGLRKAGMPE